MDLRGCAISPVLSSTTDGGTALDFQGANLTCAGMGAR
jgi:hypothetical protein